MPTEISAPCTINRSLEDFTGKGVVIGCTHYQPRNCGSSLHSGQNDFYTIDYDDAKKPDLVLDITQTIPENYKNRFTFTLIENLDFYAYNIYRSKAEGTKGFDTIWNMTAEDGFIVFVGCPRQKEYRHSIHKNELKYVELNAQQDRIL